MTRAWVLLIVLSAIAGCGGHDSRALWRDDFETACGASACGWMQIAGPAGAATWIETVPSDHGFSLVGAGVAISRTVDDADLMGQSDAIQTLRAHLVARCDAGSELTLIVTVTGLTSGIPTPIETSGSASFPSEWDGTRSTFMLFPDDSTDVTEQFTNITNVVLHKTGTGSCEVDYVSLADASIGFPE